MIASALRIASTLRTASAGILVLLASCGGGSDLGEMRIESVQRSLVAGDDAWTVLREHEEHPVRVTVLQPLPSAKLDHVAKPSLEMVPTARVRLDLSNAPPGAVLRYRMGFDRTAYEGEDSGTVVFRVRDADGIVRGAELPYGSQVKPIERVWQREELPLDGYDSVVVETGLGPNSTGTPSAGFAALEIVTERTRPRLPSDSAHPNVVLVVMDTLRADRLSCYGYERPITPNLDALAADGVLFEECYAASPWTWPSTASILTGLTPPAHGLLDTTSCFLSHELLTLAEALQDEGWTTAGFSTNPLIRPDTDFDQGFETFRAYELLPTREVWPDVEEWLSQQTERRFFLYLQFVDPHEYVPAPELREEWSGEAPEGYDLDRWRGLNFRRLRGDLEDEERFVEFTEYSSKLYDATVAESDRFVGRLRDALEANGISGRTVVAFTSDHGEEFLEHGLVMHGKQLHEESVRVPLILTGPGVPSGRRIETPVENRHLPSTLLNLAGVEPEGNLRTVDLLDDAAREEAAERPFFQSVQSGIWLRDDGTRLPGLVELHAVRFDGMLYVWMPSPPTGEPDQRLFDLSEDPDALVDVSDEHPEVCARLEEMIADWLIDGERRRPAAMSGGPSSIDLLRKLGYVEGK